MSDEHDEQAITRVGTTLDDKWTLERLLGVGGMGAVYAGKHRNGARAAIKVLHPAYAAIKELRERFVQEGYAANKVEHDGVVKVLDDAIVKEGADKGAAYLVMELLDGRTLEDRLEHGPSMDAHELMLVTRAVLETLRAAHERGVVHRDIKPENLFLVADESGAVRVKVLDFGVARVEESRVRTMHGLAIGTPSYMAPEQAAGRADEIDGRTDLFSVGATCFRVLTGKTIHDAETQVEMVALMAKRPAPPIRTVAPDVRAEVAEVVDRAVQFRREDRFADAAEMGDAVSRAITALEGTSKTIPAPAELSPASAKEPSPPVIPVVVRVAAARADDQTDPGARPRRRGVVMPIALLGLGLIAAKLFYDDVHTKPRETAEIDAAETVLADVQASAQGDAGVIGTLFVDDASIAPTSSDASDISDASEVDTLETDAQSEPLEVSATATTAPTHTTAPRPTGTPTTKPTTKPTAKPTAHPPATSTAKPKPTSKPK